MNAQKTGIWFQPYDISQNTTKTIEKEKFNHRHIFLFLFLVPSQQSPLLSPSLSSRSFATFPRFLALFLHRLIHHFYQCSLTLSIAFHCPFWNPTQYIFLLFPLFVFSRVPFPLLSDPFWTFSVLAFIFIFFFIDTPLSFSLPFLMQLSWVFFSLFFFYTLHRVCRIPLPIRLFPSGRFLFFSFYLSYLTIFDSPFPFSFFLYPPSLAFSPYLLC